MTLRVPVDVTTTTLRDWGRKVANAINSLANAPAGGGSGTTDEALTFDNSGAGAASGATFDGSTPVTVSRNTLGAAATSHTHAQADVTGLTTADSPQFAGVNIGHASDTTLTRVSAGVAAIEGNTIATLAGGTFTGDISVPDEAYDATNWNGSTEVPTKNAIRDKIEALGSVAQTERTRVKPLVANFTLENAGTAVAADSTYGITIIAPSAASNIRFLRSNTAPPATPYSIIVRAQPLFYGSGATTTPTAVILRNSGTGRIFLFNTHGGAGSNPGVTVSKYTAYGTFSANLLAPTPTGWMASLPWFKVTNDGTNLTFYLSPDGEAWDQVATETLATFISSVDQIGVGVQVISGRAAGIFQSYEVV